MMSDDPVPGKPNIKNFVFQKFVFLQMNIDTNFPSNVQGASKKTGIMEFCVFCIIKGGYTMKITVSNTYMIQSIQLAIIQAFTAP